MKKYNFFLEILSPEDPPFCINPRPPEVFLSRPPKRGLLHPSLEFLYGTLDTPIFATSVGMDLYPVIPK